ncbi:MAG: response regulator [Gammaproteobacteria bacterium]|nr:response regulator [Gammaproteobacteria bacterium]
MNTQHRILVVDDNPAIHDDIRKVLHVDTSGGSIDQMEEELFGVSSSGKHSDDRISFEIDSALQGQQGRDLVRDAVSRNRSYTVAVVDMRMPPGWDGIETIEHLWQEDPNLQVVICTAFSDHSWSEIVDRLKFSDQLLVLRKPFDNIELLQIVHALTKKWGLHLQVSERLRNLDLLVEERTRALAETHEKLKKEMAERERMEAELRLRQKLESIGQLAAGIAHEINTPTQYVGDNLHFMQDAFKELIGMQAAQEKIFEAAQPQGVSPVILEQIKTARDDVDFDYFAEEVPNAIEQSINGVQHISKIVSAMKAFSYPGREQKEPVDLNKAIANIIVVARNEWKYVAEMVTTFDPQLPQVSCFPAEFNQAMLNLIVNSAHAIEEAAAIDSEEKGVVTISTTFSGDWITVKIADMGTGIPDEIKTKIFDPFFTTKEVGKGTGQGLAIAYSIIVDKHGGALSYDTVVGKGTTFTIQLPVEDQPAVPEQADADQDGRQDG